MPRIFPQTRPSEKGAEWAAHSSGPSCGEAALSRCHVDVCDQGCCTEGLGAVSDIEYVDSAHGELAPLSDHCTAPKKGPALPERPSIAVLPFDNLSGNPEQEYFADGISEDIVTDLSEISGVFVVARNSSFTFKGNPVDVAEVGRKLGVRFVLEGSVRKAGNRIRVLAQVVDAFSGNHLWAERYDRELKDVFGLQDEITGKIVSALKVQMTIGESERILRKSTSNVDAWEFYKQGMEFYRNFQPGSLRLARKRFNKALMIDPDFVAALVGLGNVHAFYSRADWRGQFVSVADPLARATELADRALALNSHIAATHSLLANIHLARKQHDQALAAIRRAIALEPNGADWQQELAFLLYLSGRPAQALEAIQKAINLNPLPSDTYLNTLGYTYYLLDRPEEAIPVLEDVYQRQLWSTTGLLLVAS